VTLRLTRLATRMAVCKLPPGAPLPAWASGGALWSVTRTPDELSIVCAEDAVPAGVTCQAPFAALAVVGPLDFALTGVLAGLTAALAAAAVPVFALSTYDTDYLLVPAGRTEIAITALAAAGYPVA
jgi:hypothetical protein